jgi:hypothetical protein
MTIYTTTIAKTETLPVDWEKLPEAAREKIIAYGVQRIFNDMVGGAERFPTVEKKVAHVKEQIERFYAGDIGRKASAGVSTETAIARQEARRLVKAKLGAKSPEWAAFTGLEDDEQNAKLDAVVAKNQAHFDKFVAAEIAARKKAAEMRAKAGGELTLDL